MRVGLSFLILVIAAACDGPSSRRTGQEAAEIREVRTLEANNGRDGLVLPNRLGSVKFAVIGDSGRGNQAQYEIASRMAAFRAHFRFAFVLMNGDNIYEGPANAADYREKFEKPYKELLDDGVKFFATLGNHDDPRQVDYAPFNMNGHRYYTFGPPEDPLARLLTSVRFFAIDTVTLDRQQMRWLEQQLRESDADWKICFFHHPMYTSGRYRRASAAFRVALEPLFTRYGVDAVFAGHEHFYMRSTLQQGIQYFVSGGAASLRHGDSAPAPFVARAFDTDYHFMLVEIERDVLSFQAVSRTGDTIDAGALHRHRVLTSSIEDTAGLPRSRVRAP